MGHYLNENELQLNLNSYPLCMACQPWHQFNALSEFSESLNLSYSHWLPLANSRSKIFKSKILTIYRGYFSISEDSNHALGICSMRRWVPRNTCFVSKIAEGPGTPTDIIVSSSHLHKTYSVQILPMYSNILVMQTDCLSIKSVIMGRTFLYSQSCSYIWLEILHAVLTT